MKKMFFLKKSILRVLFLLLLLTSLNLNLKSQNITVTDDDGYTADPSAMLDIKSATKGLLIPRISTANRTALASTAADGLLVFDSDESVFYYFDGSAWINLSKGQIWTVNSEYVILSNENGKVGIGTSTPNSKLEVQADASFTESDTLFAVKDKNGNIVFAVFPDGAKVYVNAGAKGTVGGFAVSGRNPAKATVEENYLKVTPDSTRIWVNEDAKGTVGGFAVSGRNPAKSTIFNYFVSTADSTRVYINEGAKGTVGGFAVSGRNPAKGITDNYMEVTKDSTRIYVTEDVVKGTVGGFAVSGRNPAKGGITNDYFNVSGNTSATEINNEARIMWYPQKAALLAGEVHVGSADSVGTNSVALGYRSISKGEYSQAMGYKSEALGKNSTAIGNTANAIGDNSYAFGNSAEATGIGSYAIGTEAVAEGDYSFAIGSPGEDYTGSAIGATKAIGMYSYAFGMGALASNKSAFAMGTQAVASGPNSIAIGYITEATGSVSTAIGFQSSASGEGSVSIGRYTHARGKNSLALVHSSSANGENAVAVGLFAKSMGKYSTAIGKSTYAKSYNEFVIGQYNDSTFSTNKTSWVSTDPLFIIGNGSAYNDRHNAMTVLKNGNVGLNTNSPSHTLTINSSASPNDSLALRLIGPRSLGHGAMLNFGDGNYVYLQEFKDDRLRIRAAELYIPGSYNDAVGATNKALYIDDTGLIGYLSSARRFKKQIEPMENTDWLYELKPVNYLYKTDEKGIKQYGLVAEEVEKVNPLFVSYDKNGQIETVNYNMFISPMIKVIQEQKLEINALNNKINEIDNLKAENEELKNRLSKIEELLLTK